MQYLWITSVYYNTTLFTDLNYIPLRSMFSSSHPARSNPVSILHKLPCWTMLIYNWKSLDIRGLSFIFFPPKIYLPSPSYDTIYFEHFAIHVMKNTLVTKSTSLETKFLFEWMLLCGSKYWRNYLRKQEMTEVGDRTKDCRSIKFM